MTILLNVQRTKRPNEVTDEELIRPFYPEPPKRLRRALALRTPPSFRLSYSLDELEAVYDAAGGLCAICGATESDAKHALDHDHATGRLRGLLCRRCNTGLGMLGDDPARMRAAAAYLERV